APNSVVRDWVHTNYSGLVSQSLTELRLSDYTVDWILDGDDKSDLDRHASNQPSTPTQKIENHSVAAAVMKAEAPSQDSALNQKYTYETFVVGSCNQFAHAASLAVAEAPGKTYNPLYLYGGVGLGKTHLMHACGNAIKRRNSHLRLCYLSSERFMNELINA